MSPVLGAGVFLLAILMLAGLVLVFAWAPNRTVATLAARWAPPPSQFLPLAGMQVHLRDEGPRDDPQPLLLLHGTSASLHTWDGWVEALAIERRVLRVDLPGFGLTGPAPDGDYGLQAYVRFVVALLDALDIPHAALIGNSFGGQVAWQVAVDHPDRVNRLVLVDATGYPLQPRATPLGFRLARLPLLRPLTARLLPRGLVAASVRSVYGHPERITPDLLDRYYELALRTGNRAALQERLRHLARESFAAQIPRVSQPTLILWGGQDRLIPPENGARFHSDIPNSRLVVFEDLGHVPHEEDPARTIAAVRDFLGATDRPGGSGQLQSSSASPSPSCCM